MRGKREQEHRYCYRNGDTNLRTIRTVKRVTKLLLESNRGGICQNERRREYIQKEPEKKHKIVIKNSKEIKNSHYTKAMKAQYIKFIL